MILSTYALSLWISIISGANHATTGYQLQIVEQAIVAFGDGDFSATEENLMDLDADQTDYAADVAEGEQE